MNVQYEEIGVFNSKKAAEALLELTEKTLRTDTDSKRPKKKKL